MRLLKSIFLWVLLGAYLFGSISFPNLNGSRVVDEAKLFTPSQKSTLETKLATHENNTTNQIVIVTLNTLHGYDIADYGYQLGRHWGIGTKEHNNGVLLIIAPNERKVRIEVGYGLEGALPDATANTIIQQIMLPYFKTGNYFAGTNSGVDAIISSIKGEYKPSKSSGSKPSFELFIFPALFIAFMLLGSLSSGKMDKSRIIPATIFGGVAGFFSWVIFMVIGLSIFVAIAVFIITLFGPPTYIGGGNYDSWGSGRGGGGDFGGFSGGGGSFGGGGASGGW